MRNIGSSNHEADTGAQITTTTTSETTTDVDFVAVTPNYPTAMTPTNLPAANIIERSASKETAISSTRNLSKEDDLGAVIDKKSANTVKHSLLESKQKYHIQLNSMGNIQKQAQPTLPNEGGHFGQWTMQMNPEY
ncbi:unnamed protein product [Orchesella dallaii]|uniref:Uncharacterized protein n=1 Tax=Orchesella dallaii TaxID=48710 RepID=A0ABP1R5L6_9HEXA